MYRKLQNRPRKRASKMFILALENWIKQKSTPEVKWLRNSQELVLEIVFFRFYKVLEENLDANE